MQRTIHDYNDIIGLQRPITRTRPPMSLRDRAGQFAPFSALTRLHAAADCMEERSAAAYNGHTHLNNTLDKIGKDR